MVSVIEVCCLLFLTLVFDSQMATKLKICVLNSKKKRHFNDYFDLGLTYIRPNIVAMGFPSGVLKGFHYRNHIDDVARYFDSRHLGRYKIYNLCAERKYDPSRFHHRVVEYGFEDHNAPPFELMRPFCDDVNEYLRENEENVAVIHCNTGKGRTGVMICAYMLHIGLFDTTRETLDFYGDCCTLINKKGVTIPSQRRYVDYYGHYVKGGMQYRQTTLLLCGFKMHYPPSFSRGSCQPFFIIRQGLDKVKLFTSRIYQSPSSSAPDAHIINMRLPAPVPICGDIEVEFYHILPWFTKEKLFQFWINTFFVHAKVREDDDVDELFPRTTSEGTLGSTSTEQEFILSFDRLGLDKANKDKKHYSDKFRLELFWNPTEADEADGIGRELSVDSLVDDAPSALNDDKEDLYNYSDTDPEDEWKDCPTTPV